MPPGDLITGPGQAEIRGLLLGRGTVYANTRLDGLGIPAVRTRDHEREGDDGVVPGRDYLEARQIIVSAGISTPDRAAYAAALDDLAAALAPVRSGTVELVWSLAAGRIRRAHVRPRRLEAPYGEWEPEGLSAGLVAELLAPDPYVYGDLIAETAQIAGGATSVSFTVTNAGTGRTRPTLTITGPATNPRVTNDDDAGKAVRLDLTLSGTDTAVVDLAARTVTVNGNPPAGSGLAVDSEWWDLVPGVNDLTFARDSSDGTAATLDVDGRTGHLTGV